MIAFLLTAQLLAPQAAAAATMARLESPANWSNRVACHDCDGPHVVVLPYTAPPASRPITHPSGGWHFYPSGYALPNAPWGFTAYLPGRHRR